jgi:hypothetical protein
MRCGDLIGGWNGTGDLWDWKRDVVARVGKGSSTPSREDMASDIVQVENNLEGYWCEGEKCMSSRTHWVMHSSETICWDCRHDPCACSVLPLEWDEAEQAYYFCFCRATVKPRITSGFPNQQVTWPR